MIRRSRKRRFYADREVAEMFADEPELVAIVDAIAQSGPTKEERHAHSRVRDRRALAFAAALGVGVTALLFFPWRGERLGLIERAAAAVSEGAVVHARVSRQTDDEVTVVLRTGQEVPGLIGIETWYDEQLQRLRTQTFRNGVAVADEVSRSQSGRFSGPDPAVTLFATRYRQSLDAGRAEVIDRAARPQLLIAVAAASRQLVTLDEDSLKPVAFESGQSAAAVRWAVDEIEARPRVARDFVATSRSGLRGGSVSRVERGTVKTLSRVGGLWLGRRFAGFTLNRIYADQLVRVAANGRRSVGSGSRLVYRSPTGDTVQLQLARRPEPAYGYAEGRLTISFAPIPEAGRAHLSRPGGGTGSWVAQFREREWLVTIKAPTKAIALAAARRLELASG